MTVILSILAVPLLVYIVLQMAAPRSGDLLVSMQERASLTARFTDALQRFTVVSNIGATLTSLATVYVFFIGTSKLFGPFIYVAVVSAALSPFLAAVITKRLRSHSDFGTRMNAEEPTAAILPSLFWAPTKARHATVIKWVQIVALLAVVWLELTVFNKMLFSALGVHDAVLWLKAMSFFIATFLITHFVIQYGLRGFAFSDIICFPLIVLGVLGILVFVMAAYFNASVRPNMLRLVWPEPIFPVLNCIVFSFASIFLNTFLIVSTEAHWLRAWLFPGREDETKVSAGWLTGLTWFLLVMIGFVTAGASTEMGWVATLEVIDLISEQFYIVVIFFWLAATAAIFSTADTQAYSIMLLLSFSPKTGGSKLDQLKTWPALAISLVPPVILTIVYAAVETLSIPFEQIVFFVLPFFLCVTPSFVLLLLGRELVIWPVLLAVLGYLGFGVLMIAVPAQGFLWSLAAPLFPAVVCLGLYAETLFRRGWS